MPINYNNGLPYRQRPQQMNITQIPQHDHSQKKRHWPQWIGILLLLAFLVFGYLKLWSEMQNYPQFGSANLTWHICAIEPRSYHWHVLITLVDGKGHVLASQSPLLMGELVKVQVEVLNLLGTSSAYKIISIEGFYTNPRDEQNHSFPRNTITLDDGKTPFISAVATQTWLSGLVNVSLTQPIVLTRDGKTYVLSETQNGLKPIVEKNSPQLCGFTHLSA